MPVQNALLFAVDLTGDSDLKPIEQFVHRFKVVMLTPDSTIRSEWPQCVANGMNFGQLSPSRVRSKVIYANQSMSPGKRK